MAERKRGNVYRIDVLGSVVLCSDCARRYDDRDVDVLQSFELHGQKALCRLCGLPVIITAYTTLPARLLVLTSPVTGERRPYDLDVKEFAELLETFSVVGAQGLYHIMRLTMRLMMPNSTDTEHWRLMTAINEIEAFINEQSWERREDIALQATYELLRNKRYTHEEAASLASKILGRTISTDAWRMRVKKYAKENGLPPVEKKRPNQSHDEDRKKEP